MNAKGETLRPSSAWEALPLRSSLGLFAWKPWEDTQETGPLLLADGLSPWTGCGRPGVRELSSSGSSAWKPWEDTQETGPLLLADELSPWTGVAV